MPLAPAVAAERARHAALCRHHPDDPAAADASMARLRMLRAEDYIRTVAPSLTDRQRIDLAAVLLREGIGATA